MGTPYNITVIGLGAMGGGMARALLDSDISKTVTGYDMMTTLSKSFYDESVTKGKFLLTDVPKTLRTAIHSNETQFVILVLQNEPQCDTVCFGSSDQSSDDDKDDDECLIKLLPKKSVVILCSTVTPAWAERASTKFNQNDIYFIDSPISGGPVRARNGELTILSSADEYSYSILTDTAKPVLDAMAANDKLYLIEGGAGKGSMTKAVHQLLAGVHIVVAAEALSLAATAGLDVQQVYDIVNGAAGSSWMFQDRGQRMLMAAKDVENKSQLQIFVKDLDIIYNEAKKLQAPIPLALCALQQFINAQSLGLSNKDDSFVKRVYEQITGVPISTVASQSSTSNKTLTINDNTNNSKYWQMEDGTSEEIVEVGLEPRHKVIMHNEYIRAIRVQFPPNDTTLAHKHTEDSLYFFLVNDLNVINHIQGCEPVCDCMDFGEVRYGAHKTDTPLVHKITNKTNVELHAIDAEIIKSPPITMPLPLVAQFHECVKVRDRCRVYKLTLQPGDSVVVSYMFFYCTVVLQGGTVQKDVPGYNNNDNTSSSKCITWTETSQVGDFTWKEPTMNIRKTNIGTTTYVEYIAEWR